MSTPGSFATLHRQLGDSAQLAGHLSSRTTRQQASTWCPAGPWWRSHTVPRP